ncbi:MAG TPA: outer membrane lipid asymmetry maintenance protein MlaD [Rhodospirillaceae bacterium]|nr:outer membrane lipid asymmetry maintenance protein MlaD [Rhodospirillaceae bacterium]
MLNDADRETVVGGVVLLAGAILLAGVYGMTGHSSIPGYDLAARFNKAEGIAIGSDVRLAGVSIGRVVGQALDDQYHAVVTMRVAPSVGLPRDSAALIQTDGLLGAKYIALQPGADETALKPGEQLGYTQDSMDIQDLLSLIIAEAKAKQARESKRP